MIGARCKVVTVAATDTLVLDANPRRIRVYLVNADAAAVITISEGKIAVANEGIPLYPRGSAELIPVLYGNRTYMFTGEIRAISTVAAVPLAVIEEYFV